MAIGEITNPFEFFTNADGTPLEAGQIYIGVDGLDPQDNPKATFFDLAGTIAAPQPIRTLGGYPVNAGSATKIFTDGSFSVKVLDENNNLVYSDLSVSQIEDNIDAVTARVDAMPVPFDTVADFFAASIGDIQAAANATTGTAYIQIKETGYTYSVDLAQIASFMGTTDEGVEYTVTDAVMTPFHTNAAGGGQEDSAALQAFFDIIQNNAFPRVDASITSSISTPLTFGPPSGSLATRKIDGRLELTATAPMVAMLTLTNCSTVVWESLRLTGTGSTSYASRTCLVGLRMENSGRSTFKRLWMTRFAFSGVCPDKGNNSLTNFGDVKTTDCGSGHKTNTTNYGLTSAWSNPVNAGSSGSVQQTTTINVSTPPPDYLIDGSFGPFDDAPFLVRIGGYLHFIREYDAGTGTLKVFPWVASTETSGTLDYVFGGGVYQRGSDCNVNLFSSIDAIRCGTAISASSLYAPQANRIVTQICGIGILVGREPGGATLGGKFQNIYFENNIEDIILLMRTGTNAYNYFGAEYALDLSLSYCVGAPRLSDDSFSASLEPFRRTQISLKGETLIYEKSSRNSTSSTVTLSPDRRDQRLVQNRNTITVNLDVLDENINRLTGVDSMTLICLGSGVNNQPTGTLTFNAPAGWSVNGVAGPIAFSGLTKPPEFVLMWMVSDQDVLVSQIN